MMLQNTCIRYDKTLKQKPSTTSKSIYEHELDEDPSVHGEEDDYMDHNFAPDGTDTPSDDIFNIHNTNCNRAPQVKSLIPRTPPGKPKSNEDVPVKHKHNGTVSLPKHYLSDDVKKELDQYSQEKKAQCTSTHPKLAKVHELDHDEADHPEHPESDLENHLPDDSYPMQDSDIEDLLQPHGHYSAKCHQHITPPSTLLAPMCLY